MADETRKNVFNRLADLAVDRPWRMLAAGLLLFLAIVPGIARVYQDVGYRVWYEPDDPKLETLDRFEKQFGSDIASMLVIHSPSGIFDEDSAKLVIELTDRMWKTSETMRVESLSNFAWVHAEGDEILVEDLIPPDRELTPELLAEREKAALAHEQLPGFLISKDGKTTVIYGWLQPRLGEREANYFANVKDIRALVKEFQGRGDHTLYVAGFSAMEHYFQTVPPRESENLGPVILGLCVVLFFLIFRRASAALLPLAVTIPAVLATIAIGGWLGFALDPMTLTAPNIVAVVGMSSSIHPLFLYFRELDHGIPRREAARNALCDTLRPDFFACLTVAVGFLSFLTMPFPPNRHLGVMVALGCAVLWVLVACILGSLMVLLPLKGKRGAVATARTHDELAAPSARALRVTALIDRFKVPIIAVWVGLSAVSVYLATQNEVSWNPANVLNKKSDVRKAHDFLKDTLGSSESIEISIDSGVAEGMKDPAFLRKVDALGTWISSQPKVAQVVSLVDILKETNRALFAGDPKEYRLPDTAAGVAEEYFVYTMNLPMGKNLNDRVTLTNDALRMTVFSRLEYSPAVLALLDGIRAKAKELGLDIEVTGRGLLDHQLNPYLIDSLGTNLLTDILSMTILLMLLFRSVRIGLLSVIPNVLPLAIGGGIIFWLMQKSFDQATISAFAVALGMAVDDTVHFLTGYNDLRRQGFDAREAISRLWRTIAPAMLITTGVLSCCFFLYLTVTFVILRDLGVLVAMMLIIALLSDLILTPALLLLVASRRKRGA